MKQWMAGDARWVVAVACVCVVLGMIFTGCVKTARERAIEERKQACERDLKALGEAMNIYLTKFEGQPFVEPVEPSPQSEPAKSAAERDYESAMDAAMKAIAERDYESAMDAAMKAIDEMGKPIAKEVTVQPPAPKADEPVEYDCRGLMSYMCADTSFRGSWRQWDRDVDFLSDEWKGFEDWFKRSPSLKHPKSTPFDWSRPSERMRAAGAELLKRVRAVAPGSWDGKTKTISFRDDKLVVMNEPGVHKKIRSFLSSLRASSAVQLAVLCRFIVCESSVLDATGAKWQDLNADGADKQLRYLPPRGSVKAGETVGAAEATKVRRLPVRWAVLDSVQQAWTLASIRRGSRGNLTTAPRVTCFQSQHASCSWIVGHYVHADEPNSTQPYGAILKFVGKTQGKNAIRTSLSFEMSRPVAKGKVVSVDGEEKPDKADKGYDAVVRRIGLLTTIPDGKTLALRCPLSEWRFGKEEKTWKFWKSKKKRELVILVAVHIIQQDED